VNVDQNSNNLPFVIRDSIQISFNGNTEFVQLEAWGQNAHFLRDKNVLVNETWTNDLPYVILGSLTIDTSVTLTIDKGCRIYMHADAPIIVDGTILVNGQKDTADRVYFTGDRLDEPYKFYPASWPGIFFRGTSINNVFNYAVIKNTFQAIATRDLPLNANPKITLNETIIDNAFNTGILALNSSITARNTLISNCGSNVYLAKGGDYNFNHCTIVTIGNRYIDHKDPVLLVTNSFVENNVQVSANLNAVFRNCIIWGENGLPDDEVIVFKDGNTLFNVNFDYGLWKVNNPPSGPGIVINQMISNQNPVFDSINTSANVFLFRLQSSSPAIDKGTNTGIPIDLDGTLRPKGPLPDLGSYEKQ
jgi:hypothetical protein